jgi:hypothetical protein
MSTRASWNKLPGRSVQKSDVEEPEKRLHSDLRNEELRMISQARGAGV